MSLNPACIGIGQRLELTEAVIMYPVVDDTDYVTFQGGARFEVTRAPWNGTVWLRSLNDYSNDCREFTCLTSVLDGRFIVVG